MPLIVKPISATLTSDKDFLGKADPYCVITIGGEKQRSRTCSGGGKNPSWTDTFQFNSTDQLMKIEVWDDDTFSDDMYGEGTVTLAQFYQNPNRTENQYVDIVKSGRSAGRILLSIEYQGAAMGGGGGWGGQQGGWNQGNYGPPPGYYGSPQGNYGPPPGQYGPPPGWNQGGGGWNQGGQGGWNQGGGGWNQGGQGGWNQGGGGWNNQGQGGVGWGSNSPHQW